VVMEYKLCSPGLRLPSLAVCDERGSVRAGSVRAGSVRGGDGAERNPQNFYSIADVCTLG